MAKESKGKKPHKNKPTSKKYTKYKIDGDKIEVKEVGNKFYVYNTAFPYNQGQYVEVFQKTTVDTLEVAIQKQLLGNISKDDCFVKDAKPDNAANYPDNFKVKTLGYPVDEDSDVDADDVSANFWKRFHKRIK